MSPAAQRGSVERRDPADLFARMREWRIGTATAQGVPAYVVFTDATLTALAERRPTSLDQLVDIAGIGPRKLSLYGEAVLALVGGARPGDLLSTVAPAPDGDSGSGSATVP